VASEEREGQVSNETRVSGPVAGVVFYSAETIGRPSDQIQRRRMHGPASGPGGGSAPRHFAGPGPGCGLGAACARGERRAELASAVFGLPRVKSEPSFVFSFPRKLKNANWLKRKIEKVFFTCG